MNELKKFIDLAPISDDRIKQEGIALNNLWMVKDDEEKLHGPFKTDELRKYSQTFDYLFEHTVVYNLEDEKWTKFYQTPQFQRRKPKLIPAQNLGENNHFFIRGRGVTLGPLAEEDVHTLLDKGEILSSWDLSIDNEQTWIKVYEYHAFDRRGQQEYKDLPHQPREEVFDITPPDLPTEDVSDVVVGLAFLSHGKDKGHHIRPKSEKPAKQEELDEDATTVGVANKFYKPKFNFPNLPFHLFHKKLVGAAVCFIVLGSVFTLVDFGGNKKSNIVGQNKKVPTVGINDSARTAKRVPASVKPKQEKKSPLRVIKRKRKKIRPNIKRKRLSASKTTNKAFEAAEQNEFDPNDPETQEELTRDLASGYDDLDGEPIPEGEEIFEEEQFEEEFDIEERIIHDSEDY